MYMYRGRPLLGRTHKNTIEFMRQGVKSTQLPSDRAGSLTNEIFWKYI